MKVILFISVSLTLTLVLLLLYSSSPREVSIASIQSYKENSLIKTTGKVDISKKYQDFQILTLSDSTSKIEVLFPSTQNLTGKNIEVTGLVKEYKNRKQVNAEKVLMLPVN